MPAIPGHDDLGRRMADLDRRLRDLEGGRHLGDAVTAGTFVAKDQDGYEWARIGELTDGTFGITGRITAAALINSTFVGGSISTTDLTVTDAAGATLSLSGALLGVKASANPEAIAFGSSVVGGAAVMTGSVLTIDTPPPPPAATPMTSAATGVWVPDPAMAVTVKVTGGKLLATVSAHLEVDDAGEMQMGVSVVSTSTGATPAGFDRDRALGNFGGTVQASYQYLFTDLAADVYRVTPGYYVAAAAGTVSFRTLVAQPF